ncbi:MAG: hypothetical protein ABIK65_07250 [Candidatus Eisenbacteria bacterium]
MNTPTWIFLGALALAPPGGARAFHDGGVASCHGCHIMHDSEDGYPGPGGYPMLLIADTPTEVCLTCHAGGYGNVLGDNLLMPPDEKGAGNFVFLLEDNLNDGPNGATQPIPGQAAGHSVIAPSYGLQQDTDWTYAPGGTFPSSQLGCTSCHDPHGADTFRLLRGVGPLQGGIFDFVNPAPDGIGIDIGPTGGAEASNNHSAYRSGFTAWCANCHGDYHAPPGDFGFKHDPDRSFGGASSRRYNEYNGDDDPGGGDVASAYLPLVPFEDTNMTTDNFFGPSMVSRVMCLSCHRAHASSAPRAGRWDFNVDLLDQDGIASGSWPIPNPYGPNQGQLCAKCHRHHVADGVGFQD